MELKDGNGLVAVEKRLAEATGPDRDIDAELCAAVGFKVKRSEGFGEPIDSEWLYCITKDGRGWNRIPAYTSSIDAALTLVPEGWTANSSGPNYNSKSGQYDQYFGYVRELQPYQEVRDHPDAEGSCHHLSRAIALCLAAIRARIHVAQATAADQRSAADTTTQDHQEQGA